MADLGHPKGIPHYPCPICSTPVLSVALHCPSCGTDLTRAGAVLTSSGRPVEWKPRRGRRAVWIGLAAAAAFTLVVARFGTDWLTQFASPGLTVLTAATHSAVQHARRWTQRAPVRSKARADRAPGQGAALRPSQPNVAAGAPTTARPVPAAATTLTVASTPRGARVQIDGVARGLTPLTVRGLRAGLHRLRLSREGYQPVTRAIRVTPGRAVVVGISLRRHAPVLAPAPRTSAAPRPQPIALLDIGQRAPQFAAKDRVGLLYRSTDFRGRKLLLVFVQRLDADGQRLIREVNALRGGSSLPPALAVVVHPDRVAIREFTTRERIQVPVLFGTQAIARAYGVDSQRAVLYLMSEDGRVLRRQVGLVDPGAASN